MALTANRDLNRYVDQELRSFGVAADATIRKGALLGIERASGFVRHLTAGDLFAGIAYEEKDNAGGDDGDVSVRLYTQGDFILPVSDASELFHGAAVYAVDDEAVDVIPQSGASYCGRLLSYLGNGEGIVRIEPLLSAQVEHAVTAPLASSLAAATTNPVLITQRPIFILSAVVAFNTKPDAGALDVGADNADPDEIVDNFDLTTLTNHQPAALVIQNRAVAKDLRIWARVGQASGAAGVGGVLTLRYIELP